MRLFNRLRKRLLVAGLASLLTAYPASAGVPGGSNVNVTSTSEIVNITEVTELTNDVILENLYHIMGNVEQRNVWQEKKKKNKKKGKLFRKYWNVEVIVSEPEFAEALADVKAQLACLSNVPGRRNNHFSITQDEQTDQYLDQVSQSYSEEITGQTSETTQTIDDNGAQFGIDYIGDPGNYLTWIAIGEDDVNVDINRLTTNTTFVDATTTTEYNSVAVWTVSALRTISPLILDMDGDGKIQASGGKWLPHTSLDKDRMAFFDFYGDRFPVLMEWAGPDDGLLCQPNADGSIDGTNLFGTASGFANGFEALRMKDADGDGKIAGDELAGLAVWTDTNSDARPQKGEVKSLQEHNITELSVRHKQYVSAFVRDGKTERMYDWWPQTYELNRVRLMPRNS